MRKYGESVKNRKYSPAELTKVLRRFAQDDDTKLKTKRDKDVDLNQVIVCGLYDPAEDESNYPSITIYIMFNPEQKEIRIRDLDWKQLCIDLIECQGHEIVHQQQFRARSFDIGPALFVSTSNDEDRRKEQEYLGNQDEIDAYSYSIAIETFLKHNPKKLTIKHLKKSSLFKAYRLAFGVEHPIVQQLIYYSVKYYSKLKN